MGHPDRTLSALGSRSAPDAPYTSRVCAWSGRVLYVGSTTTGVGVRFAQHLADLGKTLDWATAYVVPLTDDAPTAEVRRIEGCIGLAVGPEHNKALPRIA